MPTRPVHRQLQSWTTAAGPSRSYSASCVSGARSVVDPQAPPTVLLGSLCTGCGVISKHLVHVACQLSHFLLREAWDHIVVRGIGSSRMTIATVTNQPAICHSLCGACRTQAASWRRATSLLRSGLQQPQHQVKFVDSGTSEYNPQARL